MICHKHKCIFIHIPKVAGQSIETFFLESLGLQWQDRMPLLLMHNSRPNLGPPKLAHLLGSDYVKYHYISEDLFESYFKFSFVRNPYDRVYSLYKFLGYSEIMTFDDFILKKLSKDLWNNLFWFVRPQYDFIYDSDGKCLVDFIGKLESLKLDFKEVTSRLNLNSNELPHKNVSNSGSNIRRKINLIRNDISFISSFIPRMHNRGPELSEESLLIIKELYSKDFEKFGYPI